MAIHFPGTSANISNAWRCNIARRRKTFIAYEPPVVPSFEATELNVTLAFVPIA